MSELASSNDEVRHVHLGNSFLANGSREILSLLLPNMRSIFLSRGTLCFDIGDKIDEVYFPITGVISLLFPTAENQWVETAWIGRKGAVGFEAAIGEARSFSRATVRVPGGFYAVSAAYFERAVKRV